MHAHLPNPIFSPGRRDGRPQEKSLPYLPPSRHHHTPPPPTAPRARKPRARARPGGAAKRHRPASCHVARLLPHTSMHFRCMHTVPQVLTASRAHTWATELSLHHHRNPQHCAQECFDETLRWSASARCHSGVWVPAPLAVLYRRNRSGSAPCASTVDAPTMPPGTRTPSILSAQSRRAHIFAPVHECTHAHVRLCTCMYMFSA